MYEINCSLIILYTKDEVLLQKRTADAPVIPGYWGFFGGGIEDNETSKNAIFKETKEELGVTLSNPTLLLEQSFFLEGKSAYMFVYIQEISCAKTDIICYEGEKLGWFKEQDISKLKMMPHDKDVLNKVFKRMKK